MTNRALATFSWVKGKKAVLLLPLIVTLGSVLRIYDLGDESLWLDEAWSALAIEEGLAGAVRAGHVPYIIILRFWVCIFGKSEVALRSLSALFGILSIITIYQLGSELFDTKGGLIGSFLSAISLFHIEYSQEARGYALVLLLSVISYLLFVKILKDNKKVYYPLYLLTNILLFYTHLVSLFMIPAQITFLFLFWDRYRVQRFKLVWTHLISFAAVTPLIFMLRHLVGNYWLTEPRIGHLYLTFYAFVGRHKLLLLIFLFLSSLAPLSIVRVSGKLSLRKPLLSLEKMKWNVTFEGIERILLLGIWICLPIGLAFIVSKTETAITTPIYLDKYLIYTSPALLLLVGRGLGNVKPKLLLYSVLLVVLLLSILPLKSYYSEYQKEQWRDVAELVELNEEENDVLLFCHASVRDAFDYYYKRELDGTGISRVISDIQAITTKVNGAIAGKERLWLILSHCGPKPRIENYLEERFGKNSVLLRKEFIGIRVVLFKLTDGLLGD